MAKLMSVREMAEDNLDAIEAVETAQRELKMVRRVRGQIEKAIGAGHVAELEESAQSMYGELLDFMGFAEFGGPDSHMQP